ncbi:MAG: hypothetical protein JKY56_12905 [Kofleriaceae bacterium]|nr:hypothetical protein [Kofleriaceae bacterium]
MRHLCLSWEVGQLADAVNAAGILLDQLNGDALCSEFAKRQAGDSAAAVLCMVASRLSDLGRALRGELNPKELLTRYNESGESDGTESHLREWSQEDVREELLRAEGRLA